MIILSLNLNIILFHLSCSYITVKSSFNIILLNNLKKIFMYDNILIYYIIIIKFFLKNIYNIMN